MNDVFFVPVERATPACSINCKKMEPDPDGLVETTYNGKKIKVKKHVCLNADYCKDLYSNMNQLVNEGVTRLQ